MENPTSRSRRDSDQSIGGFPVAEVTQKTCLAVDLERIPTERKRETQAGEYDGVDFFTARLPRRRGIIRRDAPLPNHRRSMIPDDDPVGRDCRDLTARRIQMGCVELPSPRRPRRKK